MDLYSSVSYHVTRDGQQFGPYQGDDLVQMAQSGQILATDLIWSEGFSDWVSASSFDQLVSFFAAAQSASSGSHNVETSMDQSGTLRVARKGISGPGIVHADIRSRFQVGTVKPRANFAVLGWTLAAFFVCLVFILAAGITVGVSDPSFGEVSPENSENSDVSPVLPILMMGGLFLYPVCLLIYGIFSLIYLYRAWWHLQLLPEVRTTPGKAIGFLFIPFFNVYWLFVAYWGWAEDYNALTRRAGLVGGPKVSSGFFLTSCIVTLILGPLLHPFVMYKICHGINFLASIPDEEILGQDYA